MTTTPKKIAITGRPGSGKSTFALALHSHTGLPLHHLDKHFYVANWVEQDYPTFLTIQQALVDTDAWIIDGVNLKSLEMRYAKADLFIYFNYSKTLCYWRVLKRFFGSKNKQLDDRATGCPETIQWKLLHFMWNFEKLATAQLTILKEKYPHTPFIEIRSDTDFEKLKNDLFLGNAKN